MFYFAKQPVRTHTYLTHPKYHQESILFSFIQHFTCSVTQREQNFTANLFSSTIPSSYFFFVDAFIYLKGRAKAQTSGPNYYFPCILHKFLKLVSCFNLMAINHTLFLSFFPYLLYKKTTRHLKGMGCTP